MPARRSLRRAIENCVVFFYNFTLRPDRIKTELKLDTASLSLSLSLSATRTTRPGESCPLSATFLSAV